MAYIHCRHAFGLGKDNGVITLLIDYLLYTCSWLVFLTGLYGYFDLWQQSHSAYVHTHTLWQVHDNNADITDALVLSASRQLVEQVVTALLHCSTLQKMLKVYTYSYPLTTCVLSYN